MPKKNKIHKGEYGVVEFKEQDPVVFGRPTELTPELVALARLYLPHCKDLEEDKTRKVNLPKIEGLARFLGVHRDTLYDWEKHNKDFSDILDEIRLEQASRLMDNGLAGTYNPTIAKLLLAKHGYRDSSEIDHRSMGEKIGLTEEDRKRLDSILSPSHDNQGPTTSD